MNLPSVIRTAINRRAHELAQKHYEVIRAHLMRWAEEALAEGAPREEVLASVADFVISLELDPEAPVA